ncbi:MAG: acyl-CoA carboxylase subunit epsilon [Salinibacterium sp.]|nr:acyl-CoA carboxylase subunit epsilon [Salinibacterium sp.]
MPPADRPVDLRIVSTGVSAEEIAAVTAVLQGALDELADDLAVRGEARVSAWQRSQRSVRRPLVPGAWRSFSG